MYQATAKLIIEQDEGARDVMSEFRAIRYYRRQNDLANETAKLKSYSTIRRAVDSVHQEVYWTAYGRIQVLPLYKTRGYEITILNDSTKYFTGKENFIDYVDGESYRLYREEELDTILNLNEPVKVMGMQFIVSHLKKTDKLTHSFWINDPDVLSKAYMNKLKVETNEEAGSVITLRSQGPVGHREVDFLNILSKEYIRAGLERKQQIAENTFVFIDDQIDIIMDSLNRAETQLIDYRLANNVINLSQEGEIAYDRLRTFREQRTRLTMNENYYRYLKKYIEERKDPQAIIAPTLTENAGDQLLVGTIQELQQLYEQREELAFSVQDNNPGLEILQTRIASTRLRVIEIVEGLIENNQLAFKQLNVEEQAILDQLKTLPVNEQQLLNIRRKYDLYNQFYTFLLERRAEAGIQKASTISQVRVLDPARYDQIVPVGSDKRVVILVAILLGLFSPAGIIYLRDLLDNRIREREDITNRTELPIAGIVGHSTHGTKLLSGEGSGTPFAESLRRIRTNLQFTLKDPDKKVIMITSSISGEGKTFIAYNLATIFALNKRKVLLIGCDLRRPALHRVFNVSNQLGLTSIITGEKKIDEAIVQTSIENLDFLPDGPIPPNPAELLETNAMKALFQSIRQSYDFIILDTPPVALVSDALTLARHADLSLYVIRQDYSDKNVIEMINQLSTDQRLPHTNLLINDIRPKRNLGYYYYYGYNRGYHYGYYDYSAYYTKGEGSE